MGGTVFGFLAAVFGAMTSDFAVEALVILHELCFLLFRVIGGADGIDVHVNSALGGGAFSSILSTFLVDSEGSVEPVAASVLVGNLLLPLAMQSDRFLGPPFKVPRVLGQVLRSCGLNARLVQNTEASTLKEVKESLLIIKTTEW